jgi:hypothetical protein
MGARSAASIENPFICARVQRIERDAAIQSYERVRRGVVCLRPPVVAFANSKALNSSAHTLVPPNILSTDGPPPIGSREYASIDTEVRVMDLYWSPGHAVASNVARCASESACDGVRPTVRNALAVGCSETDGVARKHQLAGFGALLEEQTAASSKEFVLVLARGQ